MLILSKNGCSIINLDHVKSVHTTGDGCKLICEFSDRDSCCAAEYETGEKAKTALRMLANAAKSGICIFLMPDDLSVQGEIAVTRKGYESRYNINGKKNKGHGGS